MTLTRWRHDSASTKMIWAHHCCGARFPTLHEQHFKTEDFFGNHKPNWKPVFKCLTVA